MADENAFLQSGATAGFGIRLSYDTDQSRLFVVEAFENAPAFTAGLDRGSEITGIGTSASNIRSVTSLFAQGGSGAVSDALGPSTPGTARVLRFLDTSGTEIVTTVTKANYGISPLSPRYGVKIIEDRGRKIGYLNLRTFIDSANAQLRAAFGQFRAEGVTELVIDFRYNGGGLVSTADLMGDLMGRGRFASDVWSITRFRPSRSSSNETRNFRSEIQSIAPTKIAFIGTDGTASASELVINSMKSYLNTDIALIGTNTFGKPVGQIGLDRTQCDDRLRVVAFAKQNADGEGDYYSGLASTLSRSCRADDDFATALGNPAEASITQALDFLAGESCTPIIPSGSMINEQASQATATRRELLMPKAPNPAQREMPGTF
ncbi:Carboxyl-terminal protease [hydrothermal vent metagenome]|uniref:Carboxyl-terminal protease n=1 Tax=hydrothermal vent metagenome TaxID=652676 RepID=A0A3B0SDY9_9ZZZZ